jgi:aminopeptidase N
VTARDNITRAEAIERAGLLTVTSYDVLLDLTTGPDVFRTTCTATFGAREPGASTYVDLNVARVARVTLNGQDLDVAAVAHGTRVTLDGVQAENVLVIEADGEYSRTGEGLHRFVDPVDDEVYLYSQFETFDAHRMYACFDQPDLKAEFRLTVTAPAHWEIVSNGAVTAREELADGIARTTFGATPRISTYITALVAGPYHHVHDEHDGIPLGVYCRRSLAEHLDAGPVFEVTKQGFDYFHDAFGARYPFAKYDQLFVPEFNAGAMENAGCVTILEDYVFRSKVTDAAYERRAETILHELAHMWFGDLVTMRWWDDLWLNESFATFVSVMCQAEATRWPAAWTTFANVEKSWAYRQDQLPSSHPIWADIVDIDAVEVNFDGITYAKGASVLKQLVAWVGREEFLAGIRTYFERFAFGNTELSDLLSALEEVSGRDLSSWSKEWLQSAGVNTLRPQFTLGADSTYTTFSVLQEAPAAHDTLRSHRLAIGLYDKTTDGLVRRQSVELDVVGAVTEVPQLVGQLAADVVLVNDNDLTYSKIRLDPASLHVVVNHIGEFNDSLPRALCWAAAWDMVRNAEMRARDYLTMVLTGIGGEDDIGVVQTTLRQALGAITFFSAPDRMGAASAELADEALRMVQAAEPGGDSQLAWARVFASTAETAEHLALVRSWLEGSVTLPGLTIDTDLRWHLLRQLTSHGAATDAEIDAEEARDATAAGQRYAAACRASRPTAAAKASAWKSLLDDQLANAQQSALISGFQQPHQIELLRPYVDAYFEMVPRIWESRTSEMAQDLVVGLFPSFVVEQPVVDKVDAFLSSYDAPAPLRRLLLESRDSLVRALRARTFDAS